MNEQELLAKLGQKQIEIDALTASREFALSVLAGVISGEVAPERVVVNLTDKCVFRAKEGERPPMPAHIGDLYMFDAGACKCVYGIERPDTSTQSNRLIAALAKGQVKPEDVSIIERPDGSIDWQCAKLDMPAEEGPAKEAA